MNTVLGQFAYAPAVWDPLSARLAERVGFKALAIGGYALGASTATTEPLLTLTQLADATRAICSSVSVPVIVDAGTGYGDPMHIMKTVRDLERAGAAAVHIEDQFFPKRAHYHRGIEHVVSVDEMCTRIEYAVRARSGPMTVIARTDAIATDGFDEGIKRGRAYAEAGAEMILLFPGSIAEAEAAPKLIGVPLVVVNSPGNRFGRPILTARQAERMGYRVVIDSAGALLGAYLGAKAYLDDVMHHRGTSGATRTLIPARKELEDVIGLEEYYQIEEETVERDA